MTLVVVTPWEGHDFSRARWSSSLPGFSPCGAIDLDKDAVLFQQTEEPAISRHHRWSLLLSVAYVMLAIANGTGFWYRRDADHAINACLWLMAAIIWAYKSKHTGERQITKLNISVSEERNDAKQ